MYKSETIFALGTAPGLAAIAIVRISGPDAHSALDTLARAPVPADRTMRLRSLCDPSTSEIIDQALVVAFPRENSPTGEPYAEVHSHGGVAVPAAVLRVLGSMSGLRLAEPGEFARRALVNDRLDLTQVEGIADLITAETEAQRRQAVKLVQGELSAQVAAWRQILTEAQAMLEASIDFSDEDIPDALVADAVVAIGALAEDIRSRLHGAKAGGLVRDGLEVAIIGPPNVGKSSLINRLAKREVALTSPSPGTTRDVIELRCVVNGHLVLFLDTAGLREATDPVEQAGVALARRRASEADLRIIVWAPVCDQDPQPGDDDILVWNKSDIAPGPGINVSAKSGSGLKDLLDVIAARLFSMVAGADVVVRERHRVMLEEALAHLDRATRSAEDVELCAEEVRLGAMALDRMIGRIDCEEVLGRIFSQLCIGK